MGEVFSLPRGIPATPSKSSEPPDEVLSVRMRETFEASRKEDRKLASLPEEEPWYLAMRPDDNCAEIHVYRRK